MDAQVKEKCDPKIVEGIPPAIAAEPHVGLWALRATASFGRPKGGSWAVQVLF